MHEKDIFAANPDKAHSRIDINAFIMESLFFILTLIWTLNPNKFNIYIITQIVIGIPFVYVSSLAYSKIGYWKETKLWDMLGWFTHNTSNIFILNVVGLMTSSFNKNLSFLYFGVVIILMAIYSSINLVYKPKSLKEKSFKFLYFILILFLGGILPVILL